MHVEEMTLGGAVHTQNRPLVVLRTERLPCALLGLFFFFFSLSFSFLLLLLPLFLFLFLFFLGLFLEHDVSLGFARFAGNESVPEGVVGVAKQMHRHAGLTHAPKEMWATLVPPMEVLKATHGAHALHALSAGTEVQHALPAHVAHQHVRPRGQMREGPRTSRLAEAKRAPSEVPRGSPHPKSLNFNAPILQVDDIRAQHCLYLSPSKRFKKHFMISGNENLVFVWQPVHPHNKIFQLSISFLWVS